MNTMIRYNDEIAAIASPLRVHFAPPFDTADELDPRRRFVYAMALCARDIQTGELPGPYSDEAAAVYARGALMLEDEFLAHAHENDTELAGRFLVPLEQIALRREELA